MVQLRRHAPRASILSTRGPPPHARMQALANASILSAPVISGSIDDPESIVPLEKHADGDVIGFLDIRDILLHLLATVGDLDDLLAAPEEVRMERLEAAGALLRETQLQDVEPYGHDGNFLHGGQVRRSLLRIVACHFLPLS